LIGWPDRLAWLPGLLTTVLHLPSPAFTASGQTPSSAGIVLLRLTQSLLPYITPLFLLTNTLAHLCHSNLHYSFYLLPSNPATAVRNHGRPEPKGAAEGARARSKRGLSLVRLQLTCPGSTAGGAVCGEQEQEEEQVKQGTSKHWQCLR